MINTIDYKKNNPIAIKSDKLRALDEAYSLFLEALNSYMQEHSQLSNNNEIEKIKELVENAYKRRLLNYILEYKLSPMNRCLNDALSFALGGANTSKADKNKDYCDRYYYIKHKKQMITHE